MLAGFSIAIETLAPHWHVARSVSLYVISTIDEACDLLGRQWITIALVQQTQVCRRSGEHGREGAVSLAIDAMTRGTVLQVDSLSLFRVGVCCGRDMRANDLHRYRNHKCRYPCERSVPFHHYFRPEVSPSMRSIVSSTSLEAAPIESRAESSSTPFL